jgi:hypothetical protein
MSLVLCTWYFVKALSTKFSSFVDSTAAGFRSADTTLIVRVQRRLVIDRDLFAGFYVAQRDEENVVVKNLHERIGPT